MEIKFVNQKKNAHAWILVLAIFCISTGFSISCMWSGWAWLSPGWRVKKMYSSNKHSLSDNAPSYLIGCVIHRDNLHEIILVYLDEDALDLRLSEIDSSVSCLFEVARCS